MEREELFAGCCLCFESSEASEPWGYHGPGGGQDGQTNASAMAEDERAVSKMEESRRCQLFH